MAVQKLTDFPNVASTRVGTKFLLGTPDTPEVWVRAGDNFKRIALVGRSYADAPIFLKASLTLNIEEGVAIDQVNLSGAEYFIDSSANVTFSASGLPSGISLSTAGILSGTTSVIGSTTVTVTVTDDNSETDTMEVVFSVAQTIVSVAAAFAGGAEAMAAAVTSAALQQLSAPVLFGVVEQEGSNADYIVYFSEVPNAVRYDAQTASNTPDSWFESLTTPTITGSPSGVITGPGDSQVGWIYFRIKAVGGPGYTDSDWSNYAVVSPPGTVIDQTIPSLTAAAAFGGGAEAMTAAVKAENAGLPKLATPSASQYGLGIPTSNAINLGPPLTTLTGATAFEFEIQKSDGTGSQTHSFTIPYGATNYWFTGLDWDTQYRVRSRWIGNGTTHSTSNWSSWFSGIATTTPEQPAALTQLVAPAPAAVTGLGDNGFTANWAAGVSATDYTALGTGWIFDSTAIPTVAAGSIAYQLYSGAEIVRVSAIPPTGGTAPTVTTMQALVGRTIRLEKDASNYIDITFGSYQGAFEDGNGNALYYTFGNSGSPNVVTTVGTVSNNDAVTLKEIATETNQDGYDFQYREGSSGDWTTVELDDDVTTYALTGLSAGTAYQWRVRAEGDGTTYTDSDWTSEQAVTTTGAVTNLTAAASFAGGAEAMAAPVSTTEAASAQLTAPTGTFNTDIDHESFTANWGAGALDTLGASLGAYQFVTTTGSGPPATGYIRFISGDDAAIYIDDIDANGNDLAATIAAIAPSSVIRIQKDENNYLEYTPTSVEDPFPTYVFFDGDDNAAVVGTINDDDSVTLHIRDAETNQSSYTLAWREGASGSWTEIAGISGTSQEVTGLSGSTQYHWRVKAVGDGTTYSDSDWTAVQIADTTVAPVTNLTAAASFSGGAEAMAATLQAADTSITNLSAAASFGGGAEAMTAEVSLTTILDRSIDMVITVGSASATETVIYNDGTGNGDVAGSFTGDRFLRNADGTQAQIRRAYYSPSLGQFRLNRGLPAGETGSWAWDDEDDADGSLYNRYVVLEHGNLVGGSFVASSDRAVWRISTTDVVTAGTGYINFRAAAADKPDERSILERIATGDVVRLRIMDTDPGGTFSTVLGVAAAFAGGTEAMAAPTTIAIPANVLDSAASFAGGAEAMAAAVSSDAVIVDPLSAAASFAGGAEAMTAPLSHDLTAAAAFAGGAEAMAAPISLSIVDEQVAAVFAGGTEAMTATVTDEAPAAAQSYLVYDTDFAITADEAKAGVAVDGTQWDNQTWTGTPYVALIYPASLGAPTAIYYYPTASPNTHNQSNVFYTFPTALDIDGTDYTVMITIGTQTYPSGSAGQTFRIVF